jgi:hypothetical protein
MLGHLRALARPVNSLPYLLACLLLLLHQRGSKRLLLTLLLLLLLTMTLKQTFSHQHPQGHCMHPHIYCTGQLSLRSSKSNSAQLDRVD